MALIWKAGLFASVVLELEMNASTQRSPFSVYSVQKNRPWGGAAYIQGESFTLQLNLWKHLHR